MRNMNYWILYFSVSLYYQCVWQVEKNTDGFHKLNLELTGVPYCQRQFTHIREPT